MYQSKCNRCGRNRFWRVRRGKLRCKNCLYEFKPKIGNVSLSTSQWKKLLHWFLRCQSTNVVGEETGISKYKILKALRLIREVMMVDIPDVFDGMVDDTGARDLLPIITKKVRADSRVCSDTWRAYTGLAAKGYVHRTIEHGEKEYVDKENKTNHINGLEGFFGYLKRRLVSRAGIRRERLPLYLAEYVWRYNNRELPINKKINKLLSLVAKI